MAIDYSTNFNLPAPDINEAFNPSLHMTGLRDATETALTGLPQFRYGGADTTLTTGGTGVRTIEFDTPFPAVCDGVQIQNRYADGNTVFSVTAITASGFTVRSYTAGTSSARFSVPFMYTAMGR
ncbi:hypothetical protein [Cumulibacter soli]|uniref:hypothetical protein n=1 Tax=Cumulibacter soli TaxID=2546344 RepID=UPI0010676ED0|nr:hypothetical protein [Cumulibacter soli]